MWKNTEIAKLAEQLLRESVDTKISVEMRNQQRISYAYGNTPSSQNTSLARIKQELENQY